MVEPSNPNLDIRETYTLGVNRPGNFETRSGRTHAAFFTPYLVSGMTLIDCGCGPGSITVDLAAQVAPGSVLGIDINASSLARASERAVAHGLHNIRLEQASIYAIPAADQSADAIFIHAVLHHLSEPEAALAEALRVLKPGGVIGVREPDFAGHIFEPAGYPLQRFIELWAQLTSHNGGDPYFGRSVGRRLMEAGCQDVVATASYETHGTPETIDASRKSLQSNLTPDGTLGRQFLNLGLLDETELATLYADCQAWHDAPGAFSARPWCEAVGRKASMSTGS